MLFAYWPWFWLPLAEHLAARVRRLVGGRVLRAVCSLVLCWTTAALALTAHGRSRPAAAEYDAIVVAGCRVLPGGEPSRALRRRTEYAVQLFRDGRAPIIATTGGWGDHGPEEARVAADLAHALGVPRDRLVEERTSHSTETNAEFLRPMVGAGARVLVVTDEYHAFRTRRVFRRHFAAAEVDAAPSSFRSTMRGAFREVYAVVIYGLLGRL